MCIRNHLIYLYIIFVIREYILSMLITRLATSRPVFANQNDTDKILLVVLVYNLECIQTNPVESRPDWISIVLVP